MKGSFRYTTINSATLSKSFGDDDDVATTDDKICAVPGDVGEHHTTIGVRGNRARRKNKNNKKKKEPSASRPH